MTSPESQTQNKDAERDKLGLQRIQLENERLQREIEGLELQNQEKLKPFYLRKTFWITAFPCLLALVGGWMQYSSGRDKVADAELVYAQAELKKERAEFQKSVLENDNKKLENDNKKLEEKRERVQADLDQLTQQGDLQNRIDGATSAFQRLQDKLKSIEEISPEIREDLLTSLGEEVNIGQEAIRAPSPPGHLEIGKPQALHERVREGYVVCHDSRLKIPLWVQYKLSAAELRGPVSRNDDFRPDASIPFRSRAELEDYTGSGFDFGPMAPAGDMRRSEKVMSESFLLSNMAPQIGVGFNRNIWSSLETAVRRWVQERGPLTIITGPIFAVENYRVSYEVIGENNVAVPTHFFKIVVDNNDPDNVLALAFMIPNENLSGQDYRDYLTTINRIELATGIDFLSALPPAVQDAVESTEAQTVW